MTVKMTLCPRFMALLSAACSGLPCLFIPMTDINLQKVAELLYQGGEVGIGDGAVARAARIAQKQFFTPPTDSTSLTRG